jgi:hypothetical protein
VSRITRINRTLRSAALLLLGAIAVHWLQYLGAYGHDAAAELHRQGHGYLVELIPSLLAAAFALLTSAALIRILRPFDERPRSGALTGTWVAYTAALLAIFAGQELSEGVLTPGHATGMEAILGSGGWMAAPLAAAVAWLIALVDRVLGRAEASLAVLIGAKQACVRAHRAANPQKPDSGPSIVALELGALAFGLARRPPPASLPA